MRTLRADLASLDEVAALAAAVGERHGPARRARLERRHRLARAARGSAPDGHELRFAVNYLAGYALIRRLLPLLRASAPARIVQVASAGQAPLDFRDVMLERGYDGSRAYAQSKLAQIMLMLDLAEELDPAEVTRDRAASRRPTCPRRWSRRPGSTRCRRSSTASTRPGA